MSTKLLFSVSLLTLTFIMTQPASAKLKLSKEIFRTVPFSSQYSEDGALIRSVDFKSVNALIPKLEKKYKTLLNRRKLEDRNEAHITVITPPEAKTGFIPNNIGIDQVITTTEMITKYKSTLQQTEFYIVCLGMQKNAQGNIVFYLVVESEDILNIRNEIANIVIKSGRTDILFEPAKGYYPHITIGYIGGDVHGVSKGPETCVEDIKMSPFKNWN